MLPAARRAAPAILDSYSSSGVAVASLSGVLCFASFPLGSPSGIAAVQPDESRVAAGSAVARVALLEQRDLHPLASGEVRGGGTDETATHDNDRLHDASAGPVADVVADRPPSTSMISCASSASWLLCCW